MTLHVQLITMLTMIAGGVYLGFAFETYRRLTRDLRKNLLFLYVLELGFWFIQTAVLFYILFKVNEGELRIYVFLACLLGYSMYVVIFQKGYQKVLEGSIRIIKAFFRQVFAVVQTMLIQPVWALLTFLFKLLNGIIISIIRLLSYPFRWLLQCVKWLLPDVFLKKASQMYVICSTMVNKHLKNVKKFIQKWR